MAELLLKVDQYTIKMIAGDIEKEQALDIEYYTSKLSKLFGISERTLLYYVDQDYNVEFENNCAYVIFLYKGLYCRVYCRLEL